MRARAPARRRTGSMISIRTEPPGLSSPDLRTRLKAHLWRRGWLTLYGLWREETLVRIGPPQPVWGSDVILLWRALLLAPAEVLPEALAEYRVVRAKAPETVMLAATGVVSQPLHFSNAKMIRDLKRATVDLDVPRRQEDRVPGATALDLDFAPTTGAGTRRTSSSNRGGFGRGAPTSVRRSSWRLWPRFGPRMCLNRLRSLRGTTRLR